MKIKSILQIIGLSLAISALFWMLLDARIIVEITDTLPEIIVEDYIIPEGFLLKAYLKFGIIEAYLLEVIGFILCVIGAYIGDKQIILTDEGN